MLNRVVLVGRITKDPELRNTQSGVSYVMFTLAVNRMFSSQSGEKETDFINCTIWRAQAENLSKYIKKGGLLGVEGRIQTRTYEDPNTGRKYITEVICDTVSFLEPKSASSNQSDYSQGGQYESKQKETKSSTKQSSNPFDDLDRQIDISNDDLPF